MRAKILTLFFAGTSGNAIYPYINIQPDDQAQKHNWMYEEASDATGVEGQGPTANPKSIFDLHIILTYNSKLYDPSYGKIYTSLLDFEQKALAGLLSKRFSWPINEDDYDGTDFDGTPETLPTLQVDLFRKDSANLDLCIETKDF